jgi:hypothetical protein
MNLNHESKDLKNLTKFFKKASTTHSKLLVSSTLTSQAYAMKQANQRVLGRHLVIRNTRFFTSSLRYVPAKKFGDPRTNYAEAGSIERDRFSGWEEQQTGERSDKNRVATSAARGGNFQNVMKGRARLKRGNQFRTVSDYKRRKVRKKQALLLMLRETQKQKLDFIIRRQDTTKRTKGLIPGVYMWKGNKLLRVQSFGKQYKPDKIDWMGKSLKIVEKEAEFFDVFAKEFKREAKKKGVM